MADLEQFNIFRGLSEEKLNKIRSIIEIQHFGAGDAVIRDGDVADFRDNTMATYQILYWKDIPAQIRVYKAKRAVPHVLPERFQQEIDRVAMEEGIVGSDAYLDSWQWSEKMEYPGNAEDVVSLILAELEKAYEAAKMK